MKVLLDKELQKSRVFPKTMSPIQEVKLLQDKDSAEDAMILNGLGKSHVLARDQRVLGKLMNLEKLESTYGDNIFDINEIKKLAIKYHLRFLPTEYFIGKLDIEVVSKIKQFSKQSGTMLNEATLNYSFYILAPQEQFNLAVEIVYNPKPIDPIIFYKINDKHYKMIHKWGNDFTIFRLLEGWSWTGLGHMRATRFFQILPFATILTAFLMPHYSAYGILTSVIAMICSFLLALLFTSKYTMSDIEGTRRFFSLHNWNQPYKYEKR